MYPPQFIASLTPHTSLFTTHNGNRPHKPENVDAFLEALKPAYDAVIAEPENVFFQVFQNPQNPGEFKFIENWNGSVEWFMSVRIHLPPPNF
jgi:hypothetical protein